MPSYADIRGRVRERLIASLGELVTDNDVQTICQNIYFAFMTSLDLWPAHLTTAEIDELVESVDALWSAELELFAEAAKQTLEESRRQGQSPGEAAVLLQTTVEREFLGRRGES